MLFYYVKQSAHSSPQSSNLPLTSQSFQMRLCLIFYLNWHKNYKGSKLEATYSHNKCTFNFEAFQFLCQSKILFQLPRLSVRPWSVVVRCGPSFHPHKKMLYFRVFSLFNFGQLPFLSPLSQEGVTYLFRKPKTIPIDCKPKTGRILTLMYL